MSEHGLFDAVKKLLEQLPDISYRDSLRGFLEVENQQKLTGGVESVDRGSALGLIQRLGLLEKYRDYLLRNHPSLTEHQKDFPLINFVNREQEIDKILAAELTASKFLVCAPAGYGKSILLNELRERYGKDSNRKWDCTYSIIERGYDLEKTMRFLCSSIVKDLKVDFSFEGEIKNWGGDLGGKLLQKYHLASRQKKTRPVGGLAILIDIDEEPNKGFLQELVNVFIPKLEERFRIYGPYVGDEFLFRVIVAGRYLSRLPGVNIPSEYIPINLTPFKINTLRRSARDSFGTYQKETTDEIAAHSLFLGGGHPGCMAYIFGLFFEDPCPIDEFVEKYQTQINQKIMGYAKEAASILNAIAPEAPYYFKEVLPALVGFRYLSDILLDEFLEQHPVEKIKDGVDLGDLLRETYLYGFDYSSQFIRDDITRKILAIYFSQTDQTEFVKNCESARDLCGKRIIDANEFRREKWVVEYLFQSLQKNIHTEITSRNRREAIRDEFFNETIPTVARLIDQRSIIAETPPRSTLWHRDWRAVRYEIDNEDQWEFRFLLKYMCRKDLYNNEPLDKLKEIIASPASLT